MGNLNAKIIDATIPNLDYKGCVRIEYVDKNNCKKLVTTHNDGTDYLFTAIARALSGKNIVDNIPKYVNGYYNVVDSDTDETRKTKCAFVQKIVVSNYSFYNYEKNAETDKYQFNKATETLCNTVEFYFNVPSTNIVKKNNDTNNINYLELLNEYGNVCAKILLDSSNEIVPGLYSNVLIYWRLVITNANA